MKDENIYFKMNIMVVKIEDESKSLTRNSLEKRKEIFFSSKGFANKITAYMGAKIHTNNLKQKKITGSH